MGLRRDVRGERWWDLGVRAWHRRKTKIKYLYRGDLP